MTDGTATENIEGLPKTGAVRVKVTGVFNTLTLEGYATRFGAADALTAKTYSCVQESTAADTCKAEAGKKASDLTRNERFRARP